MNNSAKKLNILMCCHLPLKLTLGGAKVYIEAAEVYRSLGHSVTLIGINEIVGEDSNFLNEDWRVQYFPLLLKNYLLENAHHYDVVEYESLYLPFSLKGQLNCLMVCRSILLDLHFRKIKIPLFKGVRAVVGFLLKGKTRKDKLENKIKQSLLSIQYADFVNVPNPSDKKILLENGVPEQKIIVQPYGVFQAKLNVFDGCKADHFADISNPRIAFVGTFDNRKGAVEFPQIIKSLVKMYPNIEFKLMGVLGMFPTEESILQYIGNEFKNNIIICGKYLPEDLPLLLNDCTIGIFPSYIESFGFGVLEMMAMDLPVVGYDSPGINMLILQELLVKSGDVSGLVFHISQLIDNEVYYQECVLRTKAQVQNFIYENQKCESIIKYQKALTLS